MSRVRSMDGTSCLNKNFYKKRNNKFSGFVTSNLTPSFGGAQVELADTAKKVFDACARKIDGDWTLTRGFQKLAERDCEMQKQIINAVFTATLAPIVIAFNPVSKQKKETKEYLAWRQPISAVIALCGGYLITKPVDEWLAKMSDGGHIESLDTRTSPDKGLTGKLFKTQNGKIGEKKYEQLPEFLDAYKTHRQEIFAKLISERPENLVVVKEGADAVIKAKNATGAITEIARNIPHLTNQAQLEDYLSKNNLHTMKFSNLLHEVMGIEFYADDTLKPGVFGRNLNDMKAVSFLNQMGIKGFDGEKLAAVLSSIRQLKTEAEFKKILCDKNISKNEVKSFYTIVKSLILDEGDVDKIASEFSKSKHAKDIKKYLQGRKLDESKVSAMVKSFGKLVTRISQHVSGAKGEDVTLGQFFRQLGYEESSKNLCDLDKIQALFNKPVAEAIDILKHGDHQGKYAKGPLQGVKGLGTLAMEDVGTLTKYGLDKIAKNITADRAKKIATKFKSYKTFVGIVSNLFMVVATCSLLNWVYPRFMDKYFPQLSPRKNGGKK